MEIKTRRLILRPSKFEDAAEMVELLNDPLVTRYTAHVPCPYTSKDAKNFLKYLKKQESLPSSTILDFRVVLRRSGKVIGGIGLMKIDRLTGKADVGYFFGRDYWRQGYGTEALKALIKIAFTKLKLQRIEAPIYKENIASQLLVKKLGFEKEGIRKRASRSLATGVLHDVVIYALLKPGKIR